VTSVAKTSQCTGLEDNPSLGNEMDEKLAALMRGLNRDEESCEDPEFLGPLCRVISQFDLRQGEFILTSTRMLLSNSIFVNFGG
jgi:hypothetical protein